MSQQQFPYGIIPTVTQSFNDMASTLATVTQNEISHSLLAAGVDKVVADNVSGDVTEK